MHTQELAATALYHRHDPDRIPFETTREIEPLAELVGQDRAVEAVRFGVDIRQEGYNVFVLGPAGAGKRTLVRQFLEHRAPDEPAPNDWCYVNNFDEPHKPIALRLPAGQGAAFRNTIDQLVEDAQGALAGAFDSDEYRHQRQALKERFSRDRQEAAERLQAKAKERDLALVQTPGGLAFAPLDPHGEPMSQEDAQKLSEDKRKAMQDKVRELEREAQRMMEETPRAQRKAQRELKGLNRRTAEQALKPLVAELVSEYEDRPEVMAYLEATREDMVEQAEELLKIKHSGDTGHPQQQQQQPAAADLPGPKPGMDSPVLRRYRVNLLVAHDPDGGAPVVYEDNPNHQNVIGRVEHLSQMGALITDFSMIVAGALHRANGGYLILDAKKLLMQPFVWEALKRALSAREIRIESPTEMLGIIGTISLEPEPIPLDVKVLVFGPPILYQLLCMLDTEFAELFKVPADFEADMPRDDGASERYARLLGSLVQKEGLRPFDRGAVARVIEHSSRLVDDAKKLSLHMRSVADLLREADYWAGSNGHETVGASDVQRTIDAQRHRASRMYERMQESIQRDLLLIDTEGEQAGQLNGLSVTAFGDSMFGRPSRITARVGLGKGEVVDIEREVELGGALHSKGVLILSGFLSGRYGKRAPLSLSASLVFEQSYGGVEGDSASAAELCALLSAIAELPLKQSLAITGSVNQHGRIQPIGGVNDKIEGFFDICSQRGLSGEQGVVIPAANVQHLMVRQEVVDAVGEGRFHVYPVDRIDHAMEVLTGVEAGKGDAEGRYPEDTINGRVSARLEALARRWKDFAAGNAR